MLKKFISWGANPTLLTPQGYSALQLAIVSGISPFSLFNARRIADRLDYEPLFGKMSPHSSPERDVTVYVYI